MLDEVERLARLACGVLHAVDADTPVFYDSALGPMRIGPGLFVAPPRHQTMPLWKAYTELARRLIDDRDRQTEERNG